MNVIECKLLRKTKTDNKKITFKHYIVIMIENSPLRKPLSYSLKSWLRLLAINMEDYTFKKTPIRQI